MAAIKLIPKASAVDNSSVPTNFRPIVVTLCIGKLFTTILEHHWLDYMIEYSFLDRRLS
jgi:hypothetical protein